MNTNTPKHIPGPWSAMDVTGLFYPRVGPHVQSDLAVARYIVATGGLSPQASDDDCKPFEIALAIANWEALTRKGVGVVYTHWCTCPASVGASVHTQRYWLNPHTGAHGWACSVCRCITQIG